MTLCAGICEYNMGGAPVIKLSDPLLKFRPRRFVKIIIVIIITIILIGLQTFIYKVLKFIVYFLNNLVIWSTHCCMR